MLLNEDIYKDTNCASDIAYTFVFANFDLSSGIRLSPRRPHYIARGHKHNAFSHQSKKSPAEKSAGDNEFNNYDSINVSSLLLNFLRRLLRAFLAKVSILTPSQSVLSRIASVGLSLMLLSSLM